VSSVSKKWHRARRPRFESRYDCSPIIMTILALCGPPAPPPLPAERYVRQVRHSLTRTRGTSPPFPNSPRGQAAQVYRHYLVRHGSVGIATRLRVGRPRSQGSIPGRGERFFCSPQRPDRPWGPASVLYNGSWGLFPRGKAAGA
jgi:hypothetical protein